MFSIPIKPSILPWTGRQKLKHVTTTTYSICSHLYKIPTVVNIPLRILKYSKLSNPPRHHFAKLGLTTYVS